MSYRNAILLGRLASGAESDRGYLVHSTHLVEVESPKIKGLMITQTRSLCGKAPGRRSVGWAKTEAPVTCPRCLKRLSKVSTTD